jgi:Ca-activated chloride channel family protein
MAGLPSGRAEAATLKNFWKTPDQQGAAAFADHNYAAAAQKFDNDRWRAASLYRGGDYATAAQTLAGGATVDDAYNRGNALAKSGDLKSALGAYDKALKLQPDNADARFNRDLVAKLLDQQKQKQKQQHQQQSKQQQQNGGQSQDQKQANQQQKQNGHGQDQKQAKNQQQQKGGQKGQDQKQKAGSREQTPEQARARKNGTAGERKEESAFRKAMDAILKGNAGGQSKPKDAAEPPKKAASGHGITEREQADEQALRSVPDDASGLLRARIRQYYAQIR